MRAGRPACSPDVVLMRDSVDKICEKSAGVVKVPHGKSMYFLPTFLKLHHVKTHHPNF